MKTDYAMVVKVLLQPSWNQKIKVYNPVRGSFYLEIEKTDKPSINEQKKLVSICAAGDMIEYTVDAPNVIVKNISYEKRISEFNKLYELLTRER